MLETAAIYIVMAIGKKLLDHAGDDAGDAFDTSLRKLARWAQAKLGNRPTGKVAIGIIAGAPAGAAGDAARDGGRQMLTAALEEVTASDSAAVGELESLVTEVTRARSLTFAGEVSADEVTDGELTGAETIGKLDGGGDVKVTGVVKLGKGERVKIVGNRVDLRLLRIPAPLRRAVAVHQDPGHAAEWLAGPPSWLG
jgi:hypothetical protein